MFANITPVALVPFAAAGDACRSILAHRQRLLNRPCRFGSVVASIFIQRILVQKQARQTAAEAIRTNYPAIQA